MIASLIPLVKPYSLHGFSSSKQLYIGQEPLVLAFPNAIGVLPF